MGLIDLTGKVALITGSSSGIGKAIALNLATRGVFLNLCGRNFSNLDNVAKVARRTSKSVRCYEVDLTVDDDISTLAKHIENGQGRLDILVHSAGVIKLEKLESANIEDLDLQYHVNVRGPYLLTQLLLPLLIQNRGQVVFLNSTAGLNSQADISQYAATKQALKAMSDSLRNEVNEYGVRVLSVYPGRTATPMQVKVHDMEGKTYRPNRLLQPEDVAAVVTHALELPRTAEITDIMIRPMLKP